MSDTQDQTPDAVETEPGTENDSTTVETAPAGDGDQPADVTLADGSKPPVGEDGIPVLTGEDDSASQAAEDGAGDDEAESEDQDDDSSRILGYQASSGFRGIMAKRAERMRNRALGTYGTEPGEEPAEDEGYDPDAHTVAEVQEYLAQNPDQTGYVLDRERAGKARVTLLGD